MIRCYVHQYIYDTLCITINKTITILVTAYSYRVLAVDHDMLSIQDAVFNQWPVVIVTNPKEASLQAPLHEPLYVMKKSTHIR